MSKIISEFKKVVKGFFNKDRLQNKPLRILIPVSILLVAGLTVGVLYFIDYSKSPVLTLSNISSGKTNETNESNYSVNGQIDELKGTELFINGVKAKIGIDGSFVYNIKLMEGKNEVEFRLVRNGKEVKNVYTINRNVEKTAEANVTNEVQKETDPTPQTTTPQNTIVDTPIVETNTEQPAVTPVIPPVTPPEAPKPVDVRIEISADGCMLTLYAPAGYLLTSGFSDPNHPELPDNGGSMTMPEEGINIVDMKGMSGFVGATVFANIRETINGPILSSASTTVKPICATSI